VAVSIDPVIVSSWSVALENESADDYESLEKIKHVNPEVLRTDMLKAELCGKLADDADDATAVATTSGPISI